MTVKDKEIYQLRATTKKLVAHHLIHFIKEEHIVSEIIAPMGGKIIDVKVAPGDKINEDDEVVVLEAMKMELPIMATTSGIVKEVLFNKGDAVEAEAVLIILE